MFAFFKWIELDWINKLYNQKNPRMNGQDIKLFNLSIKVLLRVYLNIKWGASYHQYSLVYIS